MTPVQIMFARKIRLVLDNLRPNKEKVEHMLQKTGNRFYEVGENVFLPNV